jgi:prolyl 4-hydroxylase
MSRVSAAKSLDDRLVQWLRVRIRNGCDVVESVEMSRAFGYSDAAISDGIEVARPLGSMLGGGAMSAPPLLRRAPKNLRRLGGDSLELYALDDFLKPKDCARLVALAGHHLLPSGLSHDAGDDSFRVSETALLSELRSPLAAATDEKICRTLGIRPEYSETLQAQRYVVGGQFKPHYDFFGPRTDAHRSACSVRGNRTWTFMVYLDDDCDGGATRFTEIDLAIRPRTGMALLWNNLHPDGSPNAATRHCGEPVTRGVKNIITKWFRVRGDGPVFYD